MTDQRTITITYVHDNEIWFSSSAPFGIHLRNFRDAQTQLRGMVENGWTEEYDPIGEHTIVITAKEPGKRDGVKDLALHYLLPGVCGVAGDILVIEKESGKQRYFTVRPNEHTQERRVEEVQVANT